MDLLGFSNSELARLTASLERQIGRTDEDAVPEPLALVSQPGDVWVAGDHRVLCGDATIRTSYDVVLGGSEAAMTFTDPPYNVSYKQQRADNPRQIMNDSLGADFAAFLTDACRNVLAFTCGAVYICMSSSEIHTLRQAFADAGGHYSTFIIWAKDHFTLGRSDYQRQYEPILYGWRHGADRYWCGARDQGDVWFFPKPRVNDLHPTMKPVALVEQAVANSSRSGDIVLDPFGGAGSTLIACQKTARRARLIELDPQYVDTIVRRWQDFTGREAILDGDGRSFAAIAEERQYAAALEACHG